MSQVGGSMARPVAGFGLVWEHSVLAAGGCLSWLRAVAVGEQMVQVQEGFMADQHLMGGSAVLGTIALMLAGRVLFGRTQTTSTKAACLCISFMWAGQAIKYLELTCGIDNTRVSAGDAAATERKPWPAQGFLAALCYGLVSVFLTVFHLPSPLSDSPQPGGRYAMLPVPVHRALAWVLVHAILRQRCWLANLRAWRSTLGRRAGVGAERVPAHAQAVPITR